MEHDMKKTLVVVTDLGCFKAFKLENNDAHRSPRLQLVEEFNNVAAHARLVDQVTDQAGRFGRGGAKSMDGAMSDGERHNIELEQRKRIVRQLATRFNDLARSTTLQAEIDVLSQALLSAVGFGGRARATGSFVERARLNVTRAIRSAIRRIGEGLPELERHLDASIQTGTFCRYTPGPGEAPRWEL